MAKKSPEVLEPTPWDFEGETALWAHRFRKYYLPIEVTTVQEAWQRYLTAEKPDLIEKWWNYPNYNWYQKEKEYHWKERKNRYIEHIVQESIIDARKKLSLSAIKAVEALELSLADPARRVAAATAILDRVGVPRMTEIKHSGEVHQTHGIDFENMDEGTRRSWSRTVGNLLLRLAEGEDEDDLESESE